MIGQLHCVMSLRNREKVYFLSNNVGIHFVFTYYFPICSFRLVPMFSGNTPLWNAQVTVQMIYIILIGAILPCFHDQLKCFIFRGLKID